MVPLLRDIVLAVPWWIRLMLGLACAIGGMAVCWYLDLRLGVLLTGIGVIFLAFSDKSPSERGGYHF